MVWRFYPDAAPITVDNFQKMVREGHYNNSHLYRAQKNFCLQGGLWNLRNAPYPPIKLEYKYVIGRRTYRNHLGALYFVKS